jgi:hypothetical protein
MPTKARVVPFAWVTWMRTVPIRSDTVPAAKCSPIVSLAIA